MQALLVSLTPMFLGGCFSGYVLPQLSFQVYMMCIFSNLVEYCMEIFMDDFSVFGSPFDDCLTNLEKVFQRCMDKQWTLN